jgi:hypothetical protein
MATGKQNSLDTRASSAPYTDDSVLTCANNMIRED